MGRVATRSDFGKRRKIEIQLAMTAEMVGSMFDDFGLGYDLSATCRPGRRRRSIIAPIDVERDGRRCADFEAARVRSLQPATSLCAAGFCRAIRQPDEPGGDPPL